MFACKDWQACIVTEPDRHPRPFSTDHQAGIRARKTCRIAFPVLGRVDIQFGRCVQAKMRAGKACGAAKAGALARRATQSSVRFGLNPEGTGLNRRRALLQPACSARTAARAASNPALV